VEFATLEDNIACITLNRPERLNAIDGSLIDGVDHALDTLSGGQFRVAILTGAGRGFCAGADLSGTGQAWTKPASPRTPAFKINSTPARLLPQAVTAVRETPGQRPAFRAASRCQRNQLRTHCGRTADCA
jgi:enoyl-CoA hydratase/carnithine racemase